MLYKNFYSNVSRPDQGRGLLPSVAYYSMRVLWSGFCLFLGFKEIFRFKRMNSSALQDKNKELINWLTVFNSMLTAILLAVLAKIFILPLKNSQITISDFLLAITVLFICIQLFRRPHILYVIYKPLSLILPGVPVVSSQNVQLTLKTENDIAGTGDSPVPAEEDIPQQLDLTYEESSRYKEVIEAYFQKSKPFLNPDFTLEQLVTGTYIPPHLLSGFIKRES